MTKLEKIVEIKRIITKFGKTTVSDLENEISPCLNAFSSNGIGEFVERFNLTDVDTFIYHNDVKIAEDSMTYEELPDYTVGEIYDLIKRYEKAQMDF